MLGRGNTILRRRKGVEAGVPRAMIGSIKMTGEIVEARGGGMIEMIGIVRVIGVTGVIGMVVIGDLVGTKEIDGDENDYN